MTLGTELVGAGTSSTGLKGLVRRDWAPLERTVASVAALVIGFRYRLPPDIPIGYLLAAALLPVSIAMWQLYRGARLITVVALLAAISGLFLTWHAAAAGTADQSLTIVQTARVLGLALGTLALLWVRSVVGSRVTVFMFGIGTLLTVGLAGINYDNPWKFSFSVPVTLLLLSLPWVYRRRNIEFLVLTALGGVSALNDSRSAAAMMLIAAALVLTRRGQVQRTARSIWPTVVRLAALCVGGFYLLQAAALEGVLGEGAQQRSLEQIDRSGSLLVGGRPEVGASIALLTDRPLGYGAGALVTPTDVLTAKNGMTVVGYDPNNNYVEGYMFGYGFEVHSFLGDLWILYGLAGAILAVLVVGAVTWGMVRGLTQGAVSGVLVYLALRTLWDFGFSPFPSVMITVILALALALPERTSEDTRSNPLPAPGPT